MDLNAWVDSGLAVPKIMKGFVKFVELVIHAIHSAVDS
jgi:hypothetical protein